MCRHIALIFDRVFCENYVPVKLLSYDSFVSVFIKKSRGCHIAIFMVYYYPFFVIIR